MIWMNTQQSNLNEDYELTGTPRATYFNNSLRYFNVAVFTNAAQYAVKITVWHHAYKVTCEPEILTYFPYPVTYNLKLIPDKKWQQS